MRKLVEVGIRWGGPHQYALLPYASDSCVREMADRLGDPSLITTPHHSETGQRIETAWKDIKPGSVILIDAEADVFLGYTGQSWIVQTSGRTVDHPVGRDAESVPYTLYGQSYPTFLRAYRKYADIVNGRDSL